ncbi:MAG: hypothetical protein VKJ64_10155 [Leptolyngbyaceae bacterium]|nr:hypothetical protein [Leptolyngbyaceae bacterium]
MKPYSLDLRQRIIDSYTNGEGSIRQLAVRHNSNSHFGEMTRRWC